jgi:hypothetical protein
MATAAIRQRLNFTVGQGLYGGMAIHALQRAVGGIHKPAPVDKHIGFLAPHCSCQIFVIVAGKTFFPIDRLAVRI